MFRDSSKLEIQLNIIKILKKEYTEKKKKKRDNMVVKETKI